MDPATTTSTGLKPYASLPHGSEMLPRKGMPAQVNDMREGESSDEELDVPDDGAPAESCPDLAPEKCLFCNSTSPSLDESVSHMQKAHGLFIPDNSRLVVDLEVLVRYLHLVIFGYHECLYCGTQRNNVHAVQQHMMGKGHCKIDVEREDSEFADFYLLTEAEDSDEEGEESESEREEQEESGKGKGKITGDRPVQLSSSDDTSLRLPSGKILSHRSAPQPRPQRLQNRTMQDKEEDTTALPSSSNAASSSKYLVSNSGTTALTKSEKRESAFTTVLSRLSVNDRTALMHLPAAEQRAILATQKKQADKARRAEYRYRSRVEGMGNRTLMKHFVPDTPGRTNG